ncbi:hypothetical protein GMJAKD_17535 [Candidatus Electrothrix aarhusensis]
MGVTARGRGFESQGRGKKTGARVTHEPGDNNQRSAEIAGIPPEKIDETVRSLSEHMGWDITKGSEAGKLPA